jgi:AcrR family transcriptional regulator
MYDYDGPDHGRPPGRPPKSETDRVSDRVLEVARREFARKGYDRTSIRDITTAAAANQGAVNYHFGTKELLYFAVLQALVGPLPDRIRFAAQGDDPPLEKVERIVRAIFLHIRSNPDMPAIMCRELTYGGEVAAPVKVAFGKALPVLAGVIAAGQQDGSIRAGDPVLLALSTVAQPVYLNLAKPVISAVAGIDPLDERVIEHVVVTVRAALAA